MSGPQLVAAVTGANGYLGGVISDRLRFAGWRIIALGRSEGRFSEYRHFALGSPLSPGLFSDVNLLVHCAYDMTLRRWEEILEINVRGTRDLLTAARSAGVGRAIVVSSMSAYEGTSQIYGRAKLLIEAEATKMGACCVRPGLVYGPRAGGMAGTLYRLVKLRIVPVVGRKSYQFTVHEEDLAEAVAALAVADQLPAQPIGIANPQRVCFRDILEGFARDQGLHCQYIFVNWRFVWAVLSVIEKLPLPQLVRADSVLGLVHPAPFVPNLEVLQSLGLRLRRFGQPVPPATQPK